jgi:retron-type reverse transcriptase
MAVWSWSGTKARRKAAAVAALANVLLDEVDRELERRGHRFVRYADDCNVYVRSRRAGERVLAA